MADQLYPAVVSTVLYLSLITEKNGYQYSSSLLFRDSLTHQDSTNSLVKNSSAISPKHLQATTGMSFGATAFAFFTLFPSCRHSLLANPLRFLLHYFHYFSSLRSRAFSSFISSPKYSFHPLDTFYPFSFTTLPCCASVPLPNRSIKVLFSPLCVLPVIQLTLATFLLALQFILCSCRHILHILHHSDYPTYSNDGVDPRPRFDLVWYLTSQSFTSDALSGVTLPIDSGLGPVLRNTLACAPLVAGLNNKYQSISRLHTRLRAHIHH